MFVIAGLGNPGTKYYNTRHNAGVWVVEEIAKKLEYAGVRVYWQNKFSCLFAKVELERKGKEEESQMILALPQKYMNCSGEALQPLLRFFNIGLDSLIVVHDELDLPCGVIRAKLGGSSGGHKGVEDIIKWFGGRDFIRIRIGISHPRDSLKQKGEDSLSIEQQLAYDVTDWVLSSPRPEEKELLNKAVQNAVQGIELILSKGLEAAKRQLSF